MTALTSRRGLIHSGSSLLNITSLSGHSISNHPINNLTLFPLQVQDFGSPCGFKLRPYPAGSLIHVAESSSSPTDCPFASCCSPPRVTATQLRSATDVATSVGLDFHQQVSCAQRRTRWSILLHSGRKQRGSSLCKAGFSTQAQPNGAGGCAEQKQVFVYVFANQ